MGTLRRGSAKDKTVLTRRRLTIPDESTQGRPRGTNVMDNVKGMFRDLTPEELLGPLNDVERRFAPAKLFTAGPMEIPLPRPRVAIVGSRMASEKGLDTAAEIAKTLSRKRVVTVSGLAEGIDAVAHQSHH